MRPPSDTETIYQMRVPSKTIDVDAEKHDANALSTPIRGFRVGVAGDVVVRYAGDAADRTFVDVQPGERIEGAITHVRSTGTSATDIIGFI